MFSFKINANRFIIKKCWIRIKHVWKKFRFRINLNRLKRKKWNKRIKHERTKFKTFIIKIKYQILILLYIIIDKILFYIKI